jgi:NAD(P)-dependent dehydrogenase (short-subunit alcohol dehydrogenase family)
MGAYLAICGRDRVSTQGAAGEIRGAGGGRVEVFVADLSDQAQVRRLVGEVLERCSRIEVLVNTSAATGTATSPLTGWSGPSPSAI